MKIKTIVTLLFISLFMFSTVVYSDIPQKERDALIALYNSTNGDNWTNNSGWKTPPLHTDGFAMPGTEKDWYGVTCDGGNTTVLRILLNENNLDGEIPADLGDLSNLVDLHLYSNRLSGSIPPQLGDLSNLKTLFLYDNQLTGSIPRELGNLSNLENLSLRSNQLTGSIPTELGDLSNLVHLSLRSNQLTGSIPTELGSLSNLELLYLHSNRLSGNIPTELGSLSKLIYLSLRSNELGGAIPPELGQLENLKKLWLHQNYLTGSIPSELGNLKELDELYLYGNELTGSIPDQLGNLTKLKLLYLHKNKLTGSIPLKLGNLTNLEDLSLHSNCLSGKIPPELAKLANLKRLYLYSNKLSGKIPPELGTLKNLEDNGSDFRWNALYTDDADLKEFLEKKQVAGEWESTQTVAPEKVTAGALSADTIEVSWETIHYNWNSGGYRVFYSETSSEPYEKWPYIITNSKKDSRLKITGLNSGIPYYFVVQTRTEPHEHNDNTVDSGYSEKVSATTGVTISGRVFDEAGNGEEDVILTFSGYTNYGKTGPDGSYSFAVEYGWSGTVEPTKTGYYFEPPTLPFTDVTSDESGQDFTAIKIALAISGKVMDAFEKGVKEVTLTFSSDSGETGTKITKDDGLYYYEVPYGWSGTVKPSKCQLLFDPKDCYFSPVTGNESRDFKLGVTLSLIAERYEERTFLVKKDYAKIDLIVVSIAEAHIQQYVMYRKKDQEEFQRLEKTITTSELRNGKAFTYYDRYLEKNVSYTYKVKAEDSQGNAIGKSDPGAI